MAPCQPERRIPERLFEEHGIHTIEIAFADLWGYLCGKRIPRQHFLAGDGELSFPVAPLTWSVHRRHRRLAFGERGQRLPQRPLPSGPGDAAAGTVARGRRDLPARCLHGGRRPVSAARPARRPLWNRPSRGTGVHRPGRTGARVLPLHAGMGSSVRRPSPLLPDQGVRDRGDPHRRPPCARRARNDGGEQPDRVRSRPVRDQRRSQRPAHRRRQRAPASSTWSRTSPAGTASARPSCRRPSRAPAPAASTSTRA